MKKIILMLSLAIVARSGSLWAEVILHEQIYSAPTNNFFPGLPVKKGDDLYFNEANRPRPDAPVCTYYNGIGGNTCSYPVINFRPIIEHRLVESQDLEEVRALITSKDFNPEQIQQILQLIKSVVKQESLK